MSLVLIHDPFRDGKPKPGTVIRTHLIAPVKTLEHMAHIRFFHPDPAVLHLKIGFALLVSPAGKKDLVPFIGILGRIVDQDPDCLFQKPRIRRYSQITFVLLQTIGMPFVDHERFLVDLLQHGFQVRSFQIQSRTAAVSSGEEQKLLYQMIHMIGLMADGGDALLQDRFVFFAPTVQHIGISLDHGDGRPKLVGGVIHETGLLPIGIPHPQQKVVHCSLHSGQVAVSKGQGLLSLRRDLCDGFLQLLIFILGKRNPAQFVRLQSQLVQRAQDLPDLPVFLEIKDPHGQELHDKNTRRHAGRSQQKFSHRKGQQFFPVSSGHPVDYGAAAFIQKKRTGNLRGKGTDSGKFLSSQETHHREYEEPQIHPEKLPRILPDLVEMQLPGDGAYFSTVFGLIHEGSSSQGLIT